MENEKTLPDLFATPVEEKNIFDKEGKYITTAYRYKNGVINIKGQKYIGYSTEEAIRNYKNNNK